MFHNGAYTYKAKQGVEQRASVDFHATSRPLRRVNSGQTSQDHNPRAKPNRRTPTLPLRRRQPPPIAALNDCYLVYFRKRVQPTPKSTRKLIQDCSGHRRVLPCTRKTLPFLMVLIFGSLSSLQVSAYSLNRRNAASHARI